MLSKTKMAQRVEEMTGEPAPVPDWLTLHQAALFCNISLNTFRRHIMKHATCKRLGWRVMVQRSSLDKAMRELDDPQLHPRLARHKKIAARKR